LGALGQHLTINYKILAALVIATFCVLGALWQMTNVLGIRARGRRRNSAPAEKLRIQAQRSSDVKNLTRLERKLLAESKQLLALGKITPAARILEQLNMPREAIQMLEDNGLIHDAAKILMRMQLSNRAGVVYARHGMWEHAAQCFKMANMPLEVAKCSRELGQTEVAGEYYEMAGRFAEAAECFERAGGLHKAARLFGQAGLPLRQMAMYQKLTASSATMHTVEFDDHEVQQIADFLKEGPVDLPLAALLGRRGRLSEVILQLAAKNKHREAAEYLLAAASDLGPQLIAAVNYQDASAPALAELFNSVASFGYAGMVYERLNSFDRAAMAFEKAGDLTRAAYCYERAGRGAEALMLRNKGKPSALPQGRGQLGKTSAFSLADLPSRSPAPNGLGPQESAAAASSEQVDAATVIVAAPAVAVVTGVASAASTNAPVKMAPSLSASIVPKQEELTLPQTDASPQAALLNPKYGLFALDKVAFCADLDAGQRSKLWAIGSILNFRADDTILTYDGDARGLYIIISGSVSCYRKNAGKESYVDQIGEFESFGELWLLADQPTAVRFVATKPSQVCLIERSAFNQLLDRDGSIARKLYKRFTMRLLNRLLKANIPGKSSVAS